MGHWAIFGVKGAKKKGTLRGRFCSFLQGLGRVKGGRRARGGERRASRAARHKTGRPHSIEISTAKSLNLDHSRARNRWGSERPGETTGLCRQPRWEASPARDYGDWCVWRRVSQGFQNSLNEVKHRRGEGRGHANERARGGPSDLALCLSGTPSREGENANPEKRR